MNKLRHGKQRIFREFLSKGRLLQPKKKEKIHTRIDRKELKLTRYYTWTYRIITVLT